MPTLVAQSRDAHDALAAAADVTRRAVQFDGAVWLAADPATNLPTAPTRTENMGFVGGSDACLRLWELEFFVEDVNLFRDLARAPQPAATMWQSTSERPARSARYREFMKPNGLVDELRAALRVEGDTWAWLALYRHAGRRPFDERDVARITRLSEPLGEALRDHARAASDLLEPCDGARGPGLMLFAPTGELVSMNDDAFAWLEELPSAPGKEHIFDVKLPIVVAATLMRARAVAEQRDRGSARARLRSAATGRWLVCHASCLRRPDGKLGETALTIEPAKAAEIAPIVVQAYGLSRREEQITRLIAQGQATAQIAERLYLSPHTVRDYVKAIFEKVGVSSRGELVAKLFADHYAPVHTDPAAQVNA